MTDIRSGITRTGATRHRRVPVDRRLRRARSTGTARTGGVRGPATSGPQPPMARGGRPLWLLLTILAALGPTAVRAEPPRPPSEVKASDHPNDDGSAIDVRWQLSPDDTPEDTTRTVANYEIRRGSPDDATNVETVGTATYQQDQWKDEQCQPGVLYEYSVVAVGLDGQRSEAAVSAEPVEARLQWFDARRAWFGLILLVVGGAVIYYIAIARSGRELKVRKIAGLEAVDEAVGRATEMGKTCLYVPGILDINDIQTVAGITVLSHVATVSAQYDAELVVPTTRSLVMTAARETVESAYLGAGRPDAYREDNIYYITDEQFGYVAAVQGTMVRERPAACFYMGAFFAESLLLAETGNSVGAIQVAGTAMPSQLPFFVAACDYTLIGEEFFAASAYLSGEPHQLGSLKGQDVGKVIGAGLIVVGCLLATLVAVTGAEPLDSALVYLREHILGEGGFLK